MSQQTDPSTGDTLVQDESDQQRSQALSHSRRADLGDTPPAKIPGYDLQRPLRAGAYGQVWVGLHHNTGQQVAVKFYSDRGGLDWTLLSREVEKLRILSTDRYIVQLFEVGWDSDPPYYVMEFLERGSLEDRLRSGRIGVSEAVNLFREIAEGLSHAHDKGILHCDLKPANVLLDQEHRPRLADFGQARLSHEVEPALGTLFYMAPEQADLRATPDSQWDVYALGALFYCMLTGYPPYQSVEAERHIRGAKKLDEQLTRYRDFVKSAETPAAHRKVPGVDSALAETIDRCIHLNPKRRFPNVQAVLTSLDQRTLRRARRPLLVLGALGPALLLVVMTLFSLMAFSGAVDESEEAVIHRALESNRFLSQVVSERVNSQIQERWRLLERDAARPELRNLLASASGLPPHDADRMPEVLQAAAAELPQLLEAAAGSTIGGAEKQALRDNLVCQALAKLVSDTSRSHLDVETTSWFITNAKGVQIARQPPNPGTLGESYAFRDYFHGQGRDLDRDVGEVEPINDPHRSIVFESHATGRPMVAFSVPVWSGDDQQPVFLGLLAMTVELGHFSELLAEMASGSGKSTVLIETHPDWNGKAGLVLEHPHLAATVNQLGTDERFPQQYVDETILERAAQLRPLKHEALRLEETILKLRDEKRRGEWDDAKEDARVAASYQLASISRQADQLAAVSQFTDPVLGETQGTCLAAIDPVMAGVTDESKDGWAVIVLEPVRLTKGPIDRLAQGLRRQGFIALAVVCLVITGLWGFVTIVLNESSRSRAVTWLRRRAGLPTHTIASMTSNSASTADPTGKTATRQDQTPAQR